MIDPKTYPSRTTSSTTRIESWRCCINNPRSYLFQNYIQHNKDWKPFRESRTSPRRGFQNYIQHNKDWKSPSVSLVSSLNILPELHPAQQGLKVILMKSLTLQMLSFQNYIQHNKDWKAVMGWSHHWHQQLPELHPAQQGLKATLPVAPAPSASASRTTSSTTRIESR